MIAPHPDDAELGCGATISRLVREGWSVRVMVLCDRGEPEWCDEECEEAVKRLSPDGEGIAGRIELFRFRYTVFMLGLERSAILREMEHQRAVFDPCCVLVPARGDSHQDHQVATDEARRAFKGVSLLGYEVARSSWGFKPQVFVRVEKTDVDRKIAAVASYRFARNGRLYSQPEAIRSLAVARGAMVDTPHAEAFQVEWAIM